jgi:hypothetical protein
MMAIYAKNLSLLYGYDCCVCYSNTSGNFRQSVDDFELVMSKFLA